MNNLVKNKLFEWKTIDKRILTVLTQDNMDELQTSSLSHYENKQPFLSKKGV